MELRSDFTPLNEPKPILIRCPVSLLRYLHLDPPSIDAITRRPPCTARPPAGIPPRKVHPDLGLVTTSEYQQQNVAFDKTCGNRSTSKSALETNGDISSEPSKHCEWCQNYYAKVTLGEIINLKTVIRVIFCHAEEKCCMNIQILPNLSIVHRFPEERTYLYSKVRDFTQYSSTFLQKYDCAVSVWNFAFQKKNPWNSQLKTSITCLVKVRFVNGNFATLKCNYVLPSEKQRVFLKSEA